MENITMTIDATHMSRVRSVCPEAARVVLAARGPVDQGTTVSASVAVRAIAQLPTFVVDGFGAGNGTTVKDLAFRPFGEPPV
jgi:hypothetical protein